MAWFSRYFQHSDFNAVYYSARYFVHHSVHYYRKSTTYELLSR